MQILPSGVFISAGESPILHRISEGTARMQLNDDEPATIQTLIDIMARLRDPDTGCPWDRQQDFRSVAPYTLEEACEVVDAIERDDRAGLQDELGDLLFQVVFHARMASESGWFDFSDVVRSICDKLVRRHPHVFAGAEIADADAQTHAWEAHKQKERGATSDGVLEGVPLALPALMRADKLQKKASRAGFDWPDIRGVFDKVEEEMDELRAEIEDGLDREALRDEAGDLLFAVVNLVRHAGAEPESALRRANRKFTKRFQQVEQLCREAGTSVTETDLDTLDWYWDQVKMRE
jgi:nucleoside triphosphate diphosphatase